MLVSVDVADALRTLRARERPGLLLTAELDAPAPRRIGLLAGSFDPPTLGHVSVVEAGLREGLNVVVMIYSVATLPKEADAPPPLLSETARIEALRRLGRRSGIAVALGPAARES
jgi:cytidyltransferase-like protein